MSSNFLVKIFGFSTTVMTWDTLVLDRWLWLKKRLPRTKNGEKLLDVGCGKGAFTIGAALRGYQALGLTWDQKDKQVAQERARICKAESASFDVQDVRYLDEREDLMNQFDVVVCCENIEHILDDRKLMQDLANCLKPSGRLLLTTPNVLYNPISGKDAGPYATIEDGSHVRKGYSQAMLAELCQEANLTLEKFSYCSGYLSQHITYVFRMLGKLHPAVGWMSILPLRMLPPIFDGFATWFRNWPYYSICLEAYKPRFESRTSVPVEHELLANSY